ncbi:MAG: alpha-amylase family protein [Anaerolineaceae bacterium]|nr:alpha-amylase family protein [Anaerolineaceae bacterium]
MMPAEMNLPFETERALGRLLSRLEVSLAAEISADPACWQAFQTRLGAHFPRLFRLYLELYVGHYDFFYHLEALLHLLARAAFARPADLRALDAQREADPHWFQSNQMLGGVCYVDLFAQNLAGIRGKIPYFKELGLTYLHLMPLFKMPAGDNDGGYAVSSFREVHPPLGTMRELAALARQLREHDISLCLDLIINHTASEHDWAKKAALGEPDYREMYGIFPDRATPDRYERTLREIFPDEHPGAFTWFPEIPAWVWTTFHSYQWDLMYANPAVFNHIAEEMLFLANQGVEIFRLDAVAFIWKQLGTSCENLPQAHLILQALNALTRVAAPTVLFKSEAIVHPDDVARYISPDECQLSYNPLLMALLWNTLATRDTNLLTQALANRFSLPEGTAWVNYVRCHDDIGWTFSDEDAARLGINGYDHRRFLNEFFRGRFPGSFARGLPFQENPKTGDCRISGTCASLAGLEKALLEEDPVEEALALRRIILLSGVVMTAGGIPLIYLGDELGVLNDYSYHDHPDHKHDSRWAHRPPADPVRAQSRHDPSGPVGQLYARFQSLVEMRKDRPEFAGGNLEVMDTQNRAVLGYARSNNGGARLLVFANFSEHPQVVPEAVLWQNNLMTKSCLLGEAGLQADGSLHLPPYDLAVFG